MTVHSFPITTCRHVDRTCRVAPFWLIFEIDDSPGVMCNPQWPIEFRTLVCQRREPYTSVHTSRCLIAIRPGPDSPDRDQGGAGGTSQDLEGRCRA